MLKTIFTFYLLFIFNSQLLATSNYEFVNFWVKPGTITTANNDFDAQFKINNNNQHTIEFQNIAIVINKNGSYYQNCWSKNSSTTISGNNQYQTGQKYCTISEAGTYQVVAKIQENDNSWIDFGTKHTINVSEPTISKPSTPSLSSPSNNAELTGTSQTLYWNSVSGAEKYEIYLYDETSDNWIFSDSGEKKVTGTSVSYSSFTKGHTYAWNLKALNSAGYSGLSSLRRFTIKNDSVSKPSTPSLSSPSNNAELTGTSQTLYWNSVSGAEKYEIYLYDETSDNWIFSDSGEKKVTGTSVSYSSFTKGHTYAWNLKALNSAGYSGLSSLRRFTIKNDSVSKPSTPSLSSPSNNAELTGTSQTLYWNSVSGAEKYEIYLYDETSDNWIFSDSGEKKVTGTSVSYSSFTKGHTYAWNLKALNSAGYSGLSSLRRFTITQENTVPIISNLIASQENKGDVKITFTSNDTENSQMKANIYLSYPNNTNYFKDSSKKSISNISSGTSKSIIFSKSELSSFGIVNDVKFKIKIDLLDEENDFDTQYSDILTYNFEEVDGISKVISFSPQNIERGTDTVITVKGVDLPNTLIANIWGTDKHCKQISYTSSQIQFECIAWARKGLKRFYIKDSSASNKNISFEGSENWNIDIKPKPNNAPTVWIENLPSIITFDEEFTVIVKSYDSDSNLVSIQADWENNNNLNRKVDVNIGSGQDIAFSYTRGASQYNDLANLKMRFIATDADGKTGEIIYTIPVRYKPTIEKSVTGVQDKENIKRESTECIDKQQNSNPIAPSSGAKLENKLLLTTNGLIPISFSISYNSLLLESNYLGIGWDFDNSSPSKIVEDENGNVTILWSNQKEHIFTKNSDNSYSSQSFGCRLDTLTKLSNGTFKVQRRAREVYIFNEFNFLSRIENHKGHGLNFQYDTQSRLIKIIEPVSNKYIEYTYNNDNKLITATTSGGRSVNLSYTGDLLTTIIYPDGNTETYTYTTLGQIDEHHIGGVLSSKTYYDNIGRAIRQEDANPDSLDFTFSYNETDTQIETTITNKLGYPSVKTYDKHYQLLKFKDELNNEINYTYNEDGKVISIRDAKNNRTELSYNKYGDITQTTLSNNATETRTYDNNRNLLSLTNALNKTKAYTYDSNNNMLTSTNEKDDISAYSYNENNLLYSLTTPENRTTSYAYDSGLITAITNPIGNTKNKTYDTDGRLVSESDYLNNYTNYELDNRGRILSQTDPLGNKQTWQYDTRGNVVLYKDAKDNEFTYEYNTQNKKIKTTHTSNGIDYITEFKYDGNDNLIERIDENGNSEKYERDNLQRVLKVRDTLDNIILKYEYDANSNILKTIDALNNENISVYDNLNQVISQKDALGNETIISYDLLGRLHQTKDALQRVWQNGYDYVSNLTSIFHPSGVTPKQSFDKDSNQISVTDAKNDTRDLTLDNNARLTTEQTADDISLAYEYNENDLLTKYTNGKNDIVTYEYDINSRTISKNDAIGTINYTYDKNNNLSQITDDNKTIKREYDSFNRVVKYQEDINIDDSISYNFDKVGNLKKIDYSPFIAQGSHLSLTYTYDTLNRLISLSNIATYEYDLKSRISKITRGNGTVLTLTYDDADRLIKSSDVASSGNIIAIQEYRYDVIGRVTSETIQPSQNPSEELLQEFVMTYGNDNKLLSKGSETFDFDGDGNILSVEDENLEFNERNELVSYGDYTYKYNAQGYRTKRISSTGTTSYIISPDNLGLVQTLREVSENGQKHEFVYDTQGLLSQYNVSEGKWYYFHYDYRGSVIAISNENGNVVARYGYLPYGKQYTVLGSFDTPFGFNGRDGVITEPNDLLYMRARYYSPEQRRFLSKDELRGDISDLASLNRYAYVGGDVVNAVDPSGLSLNSLVDSSLEVGKTLLTGEVKGLDTAADDCVAGSNLSCVSLAVGSFTQSCLTVSDYIPNPKSGLKWIFKKSIKKEVINKTYKLEHIFSKKHIKNGIMSLGKNKDDIVKNINKSIIKNKNKLKEGNNQIETIINGNKSTVKVTVKNGELYISTVFKGFSNRKLGNLIKDY